MSRRICSRQLKPCHFKLWVQDSMSFKSESSTTHALDICARCYLTLSTKCSSRPRYLWFITNSMQRRSRFFIWRSYCYTFCMKIASSLLLYMPLKIFNAWLCYVATESIWHGNGCPCILCIHIHSHRYKWLVYEQYLLGSRTWCAKW